MGERADPGAGRLLRRLAEQALSEYAVQGPSIRLVGHGWNTTYRVDAADGQRYLLRVHRPAVTDPDQVAGELAWLQALTRETDLVVPRVVPRRDGRIAAVEEVPGLRRVCALFRWIPGRFLEGGLRPVHLERVGRLIGLLHEHAGTFTMPPGARRRRLYAVDERSWYDDDPLAPSTIDRLAAELDELYGHGSGDVVRDALLVVREVRAGLGEAPEEFGLVHGDLHQENYLFTAGGQVAAIDFDDCGYGHHAYDLAVPISELPSALDVDRLRVALLDGYRSVRPLSQAAEGSIDTFVELRRVLLMFWAVHRREGAAASWWREEVEEGLDALRRFVAGAG